MSATNGGPAFPAPKAYPWPCPDATIEIVPGMSLRQYYKAAALQGLLANPRAQSDADTITKIADAAVKVLVIVTAAYADAMLAEDEEHAKK